ncbi:hypothetical protein [Massilia sp. X63]|uniref:pilus assembly PilX family protein n=1 Tax=Massilia sp. X63 TaxID=3237285 RepID=UPI0034DCCD54
MKTPTRQSRPPARQCGVALLAALLLMLAVLATSIAGARTATSGARAAGHERDRLLALSGAMAALVDAEHDIEGGADPASARAAALAGATADAFAAGCHGGAPYEGLCAHALDAGDIFVALADEAGPAVALGTFTGTRIPTGESALAASAPRYLIERMPAAQGSLLYRVTALGFGSVATTQVAVQAYYRKLLAPGAAGPAGPAEPSGAASAAAQSPVPGLAPAPDTPGGPGMRVGWREIGNWHEAVAAAAAGASAKAERQ